MQRLIRLMERSMRYHETKGVGNQVRSDIASRLAGCNVLSIGEEDAAEGKEWRCRVRR